MTTALLIMAKAPVPGYAKTRLIPALGEAGAAALAEKLLHHAVMQALNTNFETIELCVAPTADHPAFKTLTRQGAERIALTTQLPGDLGQRMQGAAERLLTCHDKVLIIGTDAPGLTTERLQAAAQSLDLHTAVVGPARDGGYTLLGLTQPAPFLFTNMPWSTPAVMAETRRRLRDHDWQWFEPDTLDDIDEPDDLAYLPPDWLTDIKRLVPHN